MSFNQINIIAEIGWNHMGDMNLAEKMIVSAACNGADICKFQTWSVKNIKPGPWDNDGMKEIYKKIIVFIMFYRVLLVFGVCLGRTRRESRARNTTQTQNDHFKRPFPGRE